MTGGERLLGVGVDLVSIERFTKAARRPAFLHYLFSEAEIETLPSLQADRMEAAAASFAVKEAVLKAVGTGAWQEGVDFPDVVVTLHGAGRVSVVFRGGAARRLPAEERLSCRVSLSRAGDRFVAVAMLSERSSP